MSRRVLLSIGCLVVLQSGPNVFAQNARRAELPREAVLARAGLTMAWWAQAAIDPLNERVQFFSTDEQVTIVQSSQGMVSAIDNASGRRIWAVQVGASTEVRFAAATNEQHVLIVSGSTLYGLDKKTGDEAWRVRLPSAPSTPPGIDDVHAYVGAINGMVYTYDLKILDQLAKTKTLGLEKHRALAWQYLTGGRIAVRPVSTGTVVNVPSHDGSLYGLDKMKKTLHFQFETDQPISAPMTQLGNMIYITTEDRKVYCLNADTGALIWELLAGLYIRKPPVVVDDHVFFMPVYSGMRCLNAKTGKEIWIHPNADGFLAATPSAVYASSGPRTILLLNPADGRTVANFSMDGFPVRIANDRTDRLYFASERGLVVCLRERDREFPLFHKQPEKKPIVPDVAPDEGPAGAPAGKQPAGAKKKAGDADEAAEKKDDKDGGNAAAPAPAKAARPAAGAARKPPARKPPVKKADGAE